MTPAIEDRDSCEMQNGLAATCVLYSKCSPFLMMMSNLRKPLPVPVSELVTSSYLCGVTEDELTGGRYPRVCCPTAALGVAAAEVTEAPRPVDKQRHRYAAHPGAARLAREDSCGIAMSRRIVGGKTAQLGQFPWLVNLGYTQAGRAGRVYKCGGTLIGNTLHVSGLQTINRRSCTITEKAPSSG